MRDQTHSAFGSGPTKIHYHVQLFNGQVLHKLSFLNNYLNNDLSRTENVTCLYRPYTLLG